MDEVVTASPGEDSPLLNTEADTVYLPVTVSGGNAEVITGSNTGEGAAVDSPEGNSPYTVVFSADAPDYSELLQQINSDLSQSKEYLSTQNDILTEQSGYLQDQIVKNQEQTLLLSILLGILAGILYREEMMDIFTYVSIASQFMILGAVCECIAILTGYVVYTVFSIMEGGR